MTDILTFNNPEFGSIRTIEQNGEPWFVGKDVALALGYAKPENALAAHVDALDKTTTLIQGDGLSRFFGCAGRYAQNSAHLRSALKIRF